MSNEPYDQDAWMHRDPTSGQTVPVPAGQVFDTGPEIIAQEPVLPVRRAVMDRMAVGVGYLPKRDAVDFTTRRAAQISGLSNDGALAAQIQRGRH